MAIFTGCTLETIYPYHNPNEGRNIINKNFECLEESIQFSITGSTTANTIVQAGTNIVLSGPGAGSVPPLYIVNLDDDISLNSISATTISASTYYVGDVPLSAITSGNTYTNSTPTTATVGGISAGSTFSGATMSEMWDLLLYPYQSPSFNSFAIDGQSGTLEVGDTITSGSKLFTWSTSNSSNVASNSISIEDVTDAVTLGTGLANDGSESLSIPSSITKTTATSHQWRIKGTNTQASSFLRNYNVNWRWRIYYGTDSDASLNAVGVAALANNPLSSGFAGTYSFAAGDYKYFSYPASMGTATTFKDSLTNIDVAMEPLYTVSITNTHGVTTTYNVHRSTNILGSTIDIIIS